ncbi:MAG: hypothetical protein ACE5GW_14295, partial [Planctomycetota bacterium]
LPEPPPADPPLSPPPGLRPGASGGDPLPSAAALADLSPAEASRIRRILGLLLCRSPSAGEILRSAGRPAGDLLAEAAGSPEFWRERARSWLKGRGRFPAHGGFPLPASLIPLEVPLDRSDWVRMLRAEGERAAPEATRPAREGAPLPEDDGDDRAYRGWLLRSVEEPPRTPTPAADLRGIWAVLWGRPPGHVEEELLLATLDRGIGWDQLRRPMISLLLNAPSMPFPGPAPGGVERWVAGSVNLLLGREIGVAQTGEIARQIAGGNIDPRLLLEECLLSAGASPAPSGSRSGPGRRAAAGPGSKASPVSGGGMVRIEARCSFPVRALLGTPERIPRLWKRLERSLAEIFPPHAADPEELFRAALLGAADGTLLILPRLDLLPEEALGEGRDLLLADGFLLAPIRRLVDRIGEPIPSRPSEEARRWLRERLAVAPPEIPRAPRSSVAAPDGGQAQPAGVPSPAEALFRAGGYRLVEGEWLAATYRPATRTLLLARAQLEMEPGRRVVVGI